MMILNLISEELKKEARLKLIYKLLTKILIYFCVLVVACAIILKTAEKIIEERFNDLMTQKDQFDLISEPYNSKIEEINFTLDQFENIKGEHVPWLCFIERIIKITEKGIIFNTFKINYNNELMTIEGYAKDREIFLNFIKNLKEIEFIDNVNSPFSNLVMEKDIYFKITADINLKKIKEKSF